jgi:hypothetical protein
MYGQKIIIRIKNIIFYIIKLLKIKIKLRGKWEIIYKRIGMLSIIEGMCR